MYKLGILFVAIFSINIANTHLAKLKKYSLDQNKDWWQTATIYQIYPKSFKDGNSDGIGDLKGIIDKLDYLRDLGITAIWLSPIYKSPQLDAGYDISDFRDIDPTYGTLETFKELMDEAHKRGLKVVLDYVPNHTSDQHEWFQKALQGDEKYSDYFIWVDGKNGSKAEPPNNWISVFKHSAWEWSEERQKFYLHQFLKQQPDLNFFHDAVHEEMKDLLSYWLDQYDVDGVRIDAVPHLVEAKNLSDEPRSNDPGSSDIDYNYLDHIFTRNQPENYDLVYEWRSHIDSISAKKPATKVCFTEAAVDIQYVIPYYGSPDGSKLGAHFSFNFVLEGLTVQSTAQDLRNLIDSWLSQLPSIYTSNWVLGNHDNHRIASKAGKGRVDALNILAGFLPGVQVTYNGEEIGMEDGEVSCEQGVDFADNCTSYPSFSRDFERTPMQWDSSEFAGFTNGTSTWLPVSARKDECNVADQLKDPKSHLNIYKKLQEIRKGEIKDLDGIFYNVFGENDRGLVITRYSQSFGSASYYSLYINFEDSQLKNIPVLDSEVLLSGGNSKRNWGDIIKSSNIDFDPYEVLLLKGSVPENNDIILSDQL